MIYKLKGLWCRIFHHGWVTLHLDDKEYGWKCKKCGHVDNFWQKGSSVKVIFVDCDGVLNKASDFEVIQDGQDNYFRINTVLASRLVTLVRETEAKLVLSSSWRKLDGALEFLKVVGLHFLDVTPDFSEKGTKRGYEIQDWLDAHSEVTKYVIIDDDGDMLDHQRVNFVQTEFDYGLTEGLAYRVGYKLGKVNE